MVKSESVIHQKQVAQTLVIIEELGRLELTAQKKREEGLTTQAVYDESLSDAQYQRLLAVGKNNPIAIHAAKRIGRR